MVICLLSIGYMTVKLGNVSFWGDDSYSLFATFNSVSGLRAGSAVEMLGIEIGRVADLIIDQENQVAVAEFRIQKGIKIYDDAIASIKTSGLIGDKYIIIDAGGSEEALEPGETITDTESAVDIGELIGKYAFGDVKE